MSLSRRIIATISREWLGHALRRPGIVYVCNPDNPTGTVVPRDELAGFIELVPLATLILVDEAYYHFADDPRNASALEWVGKRPNVVVARTFPKVYGMAGMRLGFAVGPKETIAAMQGYLTQLNGNAPVLAAALATLTDEDYICECRRKMNATRR